jgi:thioredoxin-related protein
MIINRLEIPAHGRGEKRPHPFYTDGKPYPETADGSVLMPVCPTAQNRRVLLLVITLLAGADAAAIEKGRFLGAAPSEPPEWFPQSFLDLAEDVREAAANGRRVMIYFHQANCPYCALLVKESFTRPEIVASMQKNLDSIAINMWGDREVITTDGGRHTEKSLAAALGVTYTPTLIFLDEQGRIALRLNGYYPPERFRLALDYVYGHREKELSFHAWLDAHLAAGSGGLRAEPFFLPAPYALARNRLPAARPLAVFFERADCPDCDRLHDKVLADPATRALVEQFESVQLDVAADTPVITPAGARTTARAWARDLDLGYSPAIVFFDRQGREVMRIDAYLKTFHIQSVFAYVLQEAYLTEPSFQRFISARAGKLREEGHDVDIWRD